MALRERIVVKRIQRSLIDPLDDIKFEEVFFTVPVEDIPITITPEYLSRLISQVGEQVDAIRSDTGIVIIDPLRAAFLQELDSGAENDPTTMTQVLSPLRKFARETNWWVGIPHHNNRGSDRYSGTAAIAGNTDALWNVTRPDRSTTSSVTITTRDGILPPMVVVEGENGLQLAGAPATPARDDAELVALIRTLPTQAPEAVTVAELVTRWGLPRSTVRDRLAEAERPGRIPRVERIGGTSKNDPARYFAVGIAVAEPSATIPPQSVENLSV